MKSLRDNKKIVDFLLVPGSIFRLTKEKMKEGYFEPIAKHETRSMIFDRIIPYSVAFSAELLRLEAYYHLFT